MQYPLPHRSTRVGKCLPHGRYVFGCWYRNWKSPHRVYRTNLLQRAAYSPTNSMELCTNGCHDMLSEDPFPRGQGYPELHYHLLFPHTNRRLDVQRSFVFFNILYSKMNIQICSFLFAFIRDHNVPIYKMNRVAMGGQFNNSCTRHQY